VPSSVNLVGVLLIKNLLPDLEEEGFTTSEGSVFIRVHQWLKLFLSASGTRVSGCGVHLRLNTYVPECDSAAHRQS
jgi:hypothetical protein